MVAPVVVKPLMTSKKASEKRSSVPVTTHGSAPTSDSTNHASATIANPSRTRSSPWGRNSFHSTAPPTAAPLATAANARHSGSP